MTLALDVVTLVLLSVRKVFANLAMRHIFAPFSLDCLSILHGQLAMALASTVDHVSFVDIAVWVCELALAVRNSSLELTFIAVSIWEG